MMWGGRYVTEERLQQGRRNKRSSVIERAEGKQVINQRYKSIPQIVPDSVFIGMIRQLNRLVEMTRWLFNR